ncbi:NodT family efflux transporter outer membrane factor (OMF) lipoprotein [Neisseria perflava]|uniref:TolC family protein n=1 Tax=Neisseria perflava TaxID=33053 RepID=UPI00209E896C|nr:TolC family protein [Neisseria perflava]MCP1771854.1 NodT family efflux transporter outer membrane factor (OMF) lipoprotein [Neisseria perflava]
MKLKQTTALCAAALLALSACQNTQVPLDSNVAVPQAFSQAEAARGSSDIVRWWRQWNDPVLGGLIEQGLAQGYDVKIAVSRMNEARAASRAARADLGPTVGLSGGGGVSRGRVDNPLDGSTRQVLSQYPQTSFLSDSKLDADGNSLYGGLVASWEPDIFGQKRSDADAAYYAALGQQEQVYGAQMLLAGDIADNYFNARAAQRRLKTADHTVATMQRMVQYVKGRFKAGHVSGYEVNEAQVQLSAAEAKRATIQAQYDAYVRNIAVLTGQTPQGFTLPASPADVLAQQPAAPSGQTPQGMIERRPDLRAYAAQINAYAAKLASAKADLLPRFTINFLSGGARIGIDGDDSLKGWAGLLSVGIQTPLFTSGRIKANIAAADARLQTALLQYDKQLLTALGEVDSAYQSVNAMQRQVGLLQTAYRQSAQHAADTEKLFRNDYKTLDNALRAHLEEDQMQDSLTQAQLARAQTLVGLYKALGGGWTGLDEAGS